MGVEQTAHARTGMKISSSFGTLLKRYRLQAGLSQEALATRAQLSTRAISDLERGVKQTPHFDTIDLLAGALALSAPQRALLQTTARPELAAVPDASSSSPVTLPLPPTRLLGREQERSRALALFQSAGVRLVTLTGPGGVGKTRVGLQLAHDLCTHFADGVAFVELAPVLDAALVPAAIAQALNLGEEIATSPDQQVRAFLRGGHFLLVLDNVEHLTGTATLVAELLANCPRLSVLVTSRIPLHVRAEQILPLAPLGQDDAVTLFCERARAIHPDGSYALDEVEAICERLDCLPLAIELAATHVKVLSLPQLRERLTHRLKFLRGGPTDLPARQHTMEETLAWSYELLTEAQQRCFCALSVFVGGWTLEAAEAVCWAEGEAALEEAIHILAALVDASLIRMELSAEQTSRFVMLELMRDYAGQRLRAAAEEELYQQRHASYYARLGETMGPFGPGVGVSEAQLVKEFPNARVALQWAREKREVLIGLRLVAAFGKFWYSRGLMREADKWFESMLTLDRQMNAPDIPLELRAEVHYQFGQVLLSQGRRERAEILATETLDRAQRTGDQSGMSLAFTILGQLAQTTGKLDEAARYFRQSEEHARLTGVLSIRGTALNNLAQIAWMQGDLGRTTALLEEGLELARTTGIAWVMATTTTMLGHLANQQHDVALAKKRYRESLTLFRSFGSLTFTAWCLKDTPRHCVRRDTTSRPPVCVRHLRPYGSRPRRHSHRTSATHSSMWLRQPKPPLMSQALSPFGPQVPR